MLLAKTAVMMTALLGAGAAAAQTQPAQPAQPAPAADQGQQGVLVFQPDFFADARPNTALDMVNRVPGFSINDGDGSRGFEGSVGNILINGARPASKTDTGSSVLSRTTANQVERIELIRGGAPGIDMQGFAMVVNVILKTESTMQHVLTWNTTQFMDGGPDIYAGSYQVTARNGDRNWSLTLSDGIGMSDSQGPGRVVRRDGTGAVIRDEAVDSRMYGGGNSIRATYAQPFAGGKIDLTARYGVNDFNQTQTQTSPTALRVNIGENEGAGGEFGVVYERPLTDTWKFEGRFIHQFNEFEGVSINRTRLGGVDSPEQLFAYAGDEGETILRGTFRNERSPTLTYETGGEIAYNMLDTRQAFSVGGVPVPLPSATVKVEELRGEVFGKSTWRINPTLSLEAGLRLETSTISQSGDADAEKSLFFAKPRFLATWTPAAGHQLRFRFERELGQLDFGDFAASADLQDDNVFGGNVDLEPEQRWISELSYERRFWGEGVFTVTARHDEIIDVIDRIPLPMGLSATGNIGDGTLDQLSLDLTVPTTRLGVSGGRLRIGTDWNETSVTDPTTGRERPITGARPFDANIAFTQDIPSWKMQWGFEWLRGFDEENFDPDQKTDVRLRNYRVLFAEYKPTPTLSIRAQVNIWNDFLIERTAYSDRTTQAVAYVETRDVDPRTFWQLRLRKTF